VIGNRFVGKQVNEYRGEAEGEQNMDERAADVGDEETDHPEEQEQGREAIEKGDHEYPFIARRRGCRAWPDCRAQQFVSSYERTPSARLVNQ